MLSNGINSNGRKLKISDILSYNDVLLSSYNQHNGNNDKTKNYSHGESFAIFSEKVVKSENPD